LKRYFSKSLLTIEWILFLYVVLGFAISHLLPVPEITKSILSLPAWLIIPYFFGSCLRIVLRRLRIDSFCGFEAGVFSLLFGVYLLIVVTFLLDLLGLSIILANLYLLVLATALVYLVYKTFKKVDDNFLITSSICKRYIPILLFCVLVSLIPAMIKVSVSPFPYGTIETISIPSEQYQPALRFMEYGYLQHYRIYDYVSLGFSSQLFNIDPLSFVWSSTFLISAIFSFGLYLFSYVISKRQSFALFTVLIGSFLNMNVFRDIPLLFRANIFFYVFLPFILYLSYKNISKKEYQIKSVIVALIIFSAVTIFYVYLFESNIWLAFVPKDLAYPQEWQSHVWIPTVVATTAPVLLIIGYFSKFFANKNNFLSDNALLFMFIPFFFLVFQDIESIAFILFVFVFILLFLMAKNKKTRLVLYAFVGFVLVFVLIQNYVVAIGVSNPISSIILPSYSSSTDFMPFSLRFNWLFVVNLPLTLAILLVLGIAVSIGSKRKEDIFVLSAFALALFLYLFPETFAYRFYKELSIVMAFVMAIGVWRIFCALPDLRKRYSTLIFSALIIILLLPSLIAPVYTRYYQSTMGLSIVSSSEYSAAQWLKQNTPENVLLVSDFETMTLMAPLSNKMLPIDRNYLVEALNTNSIQTLWLIKNMLSPAYLNYSLKNASEPQFWNAYSFGKGSIDIRTENTTQLDNNTSINIIEGSESVAGVLHKFEAEQNWSNASGLYISWYGKNTNATWQICVAAPDDSNWFSFNFIDNFVGWANISAPFNAFSKVGSTNWATVSYIAIRTSNAAPNNWALGDVGLSYIASLNINSDSIDYLRKNIVSTEQRYCEQTGLSLDNTTVLIILTSRTIQWVKQEGISQIISTLNGPVDNSSLELFNKTSCLQQIYSENNYIYVFEAR
jgi:hypothetical protein